MVNRDSRGYLLELAGIFKSHHTSDSYKKAHLHELFCQFQTVRVAVDHSADLLRAVVLHQPHRILRRLSGMDHHRKVRLPRHLQLLLKPVLLYFPIGSIPVIVQPDLSHSDDPRIGQLAPDLFQQLICQRSAVGGMNTERTIHEGIAVSQIKALPYAVQIRCNIDYSADSFLREPGKNTIQVIPECLVVIMCVCLKNHSHSVSSLRFCFFIRSSV